MVEIVDINDRKSLRAWLEMQPQKASVAIAQRAAMRVLPDYWHWVLTSDNSKKHNLTAMPILRRVLISGVAVDSPTPKIRSAAAIAAAADAASAAYAYATAAAADAYSYAYIAVTAAATDDAAAYATVTTYAVANVDIWPIVRRDCWEISNTGALHNAELWHDQPNPLADRWQQIKRLLHDDPLDWSFWVKWVEAALDGAPLNWDMLRKIALISPEDWRQNTRHMNGIIASIEDEFRDVLADPIRLDTQTQTTPAVEHLFQQRILTEMVADGLAGQIYDAIERFTADTGQNELPEAFQALESLPPVLESIALLARRSQENGGLLQEMREEIGKLRMLVSELEYDLRLAKENTIKHALTKSFIDQAGKSLGDWKMYGALIGAVTFFVASPAQAETLNGISSCIKSIFAR